MDQLILNDLFVIKKYTDGDNSYQGDVYRVLAIDGDMVAAKAEFERYGSLDSGERLSFAMSEVKSWQKVSESYLATLLGRDAA